MKSVNGDSRDQCEAADALTGACCANANTTKDCVTLWFAVSYEATFAGCSASGGTVPPVPQLEGLFYDQHVNVHGAALHYLRCINIDWLHFWSMFYPKYVSNILSTCLYYFDCLPMFPVKQIYTLQLFYAPFPSLKLNSISVTAKRQPQANMEIFFFPASSPPRGTNRPINLVHFKKKKIRTQWGILDMQQLCLQTELS